MPADVKAILSRVLAEIEREEETEANEQAKRDLEALKGRKVTIADIREAIAEADPDTRAELRDLLADAVADDSDDAGAKPPPKLKEAPKPKPAKPQTREGRRAGQAYDWDVDDAGKVVRLDVVRVYSGDDEPDEVELPSEEATA